MLILIAAVGANRVIGKDNQLLWHLPEDFHFFKETTMNSVIIMGRKTFESLPKLLPGREHWVITRDADYMPKYEGARIFTSVEDVLAAVSEDAKNYYIIGGAEIYKEFLPHADRLYLTEVEAHIDGDAFFPSLDGESFEKISESERKQDEKYDWGYRFVTYDRRRSV